MHDFKALSNRYVFLKNAIVEKYGSAEEAKAEIREKMTGALALLKSGKKAGFGMLKTAAQERLDREQYYLRCLRAVWPD
jgi:ribosomal protein L19E